MTIGRIKRHVSETGRVYEYYFAGQASVEAATEYRFQASSDRRNFFAILIVLPEETAEEWARQHGRRLADPERFAAAKLRLQRVLDELESPAEAGAVAILPEEIEELLAPLDL